MKSIIIFAVLSVASAKPKPGGFLSSPLSWGGHGLDSYGYQPTLSVSQPLVQQVVSQPVLHAAPAVAIAKPAATSYSSFQRVIHPVAQPVVHAPVIQAPVISQPLVHAPVVSQPVVQVEHAPVYSQPIVQTLAEPSFSSFGHGW